MVIFKFSLTPGASSTLHGAIQCLSRFSPNVSLEAREDSLTLSALNSSKSAHASITLDPPFFNSYEFSDGSLDGRFTCQISNKALLSVFKSRISDAKSTNVTERCEVEFQDEVSAAKCRLVARNICSNGVIKTYKLTYEAASVMHALFDRASSSNRWNIKALFLRENLDYFSPKVEQLDIFRDGEKMTFLSFTEKIVTAKNEILKQPLKTTVVLNTADFEQLAVKEQLHIIISVKDFRAIVMHAETLDVTLQAYYSSPGRPLQFIYSKASMECQFTLMTAGEYRGSTVEAIERMNRGGTQTTNNATAIRRQQPPKIMLPPPRPPEGRRSATKLGKRQVDERSKSATTDESDDQPLFVPQDDREWDPAPYDNGEEVLGWDASEPTESLFTRRRREQESQASKAPEPRPAVDETPEMLEPTQRLSAIPRLW